MASEPASSSPRRRPRRRRIVVGLLLAPLVVAAVLVAGAAALWHSDGGMQWVMRRVPGLELTGVQGRPSGGAFAVERLQWHGTGMRVEVDDLGWREARWQWRPHRGAWLGVALDQPRAAAVRVTTTPQPEPTERPRPPSDLRLPVEVRLHGLQVGRLEFDGQPLFAALRADLHAGADAGAVHRVERLQVQRDDVVVDAALSVGASGELPLRGEFRVAAAPGAAQPWQAQAQVGGVLRRVEVDATLSEPSGAGGSVRAVATPFEPWPLAALAASSRDLDLSLLGPGLPATRLSGTAVLSESPAGAPIAVDVELRNAAAGPWDAGKLPLRTLTARLHGRPAAGGPVVLESLQAALGGTQAAGELHAEARWEGDRLQAVLRLDGVQPDRLDLRAPPITIGGPLRIELRGLPQAGAAARSLEGELHAELDGRRARRGPPVRLQADATFMHRPDGSLVAELRRLRAEAGRGSATASLHAQRAAAGAWQVRSDGELAGFDPAAWGAPGLRDRPGVVNGAWQVDVALPAVPPAEWLAALRGSARVDLRDSRLGGVPLRGSLTVDAADAALQLDARLDAAANRLRVQGRTGADRAASRWDAELRAPALTRLRPLLALVPGASAWLPQQGTASARAVVEGRWPAVRSDGMVRIDGLRSAALHVGAANARWRISLGDVAAPLAVTLDAAGVAHGERRLDRLDAELGGTLRSHRLRVRAASPLRPPAWTDTLGGAPHAGGSAWRLDLAAGWQPADAGGGTWRARLERLQAAQRDGARPWLAARDVDAALRLDAEGRLAQVSMAPGRLDVFGGALHWREAQWRAGAAGAPPQIALAAWLEPMRVAPWLARLQPEFAWRGDLELGARVDVRSGNGRFDADAVVERTRGDLSLTVDNSTRTLGLTDLRVVFGAHGGRWQLRQAVAGRQLGVLDGAQSLRVPASALVPPADAPLEGRLDLRIPDLAVWSPWLPAGWRIGGQLRGRAQLEGSLGEPRYGGDVVGSRLEARHLIEGVDLRDGDLVLALRGREATLQRLEFRSPGDGLLRVTGTASLGTAPSAQLRAVLERFRAVDRVDRRVAVSGSATLDVRGQRAAVDGRLRVDEGLVDVSQADAPKLSADVVVVNDPTAAGAQPQQPAAPRAEGIDVDLTIDLGKALHLRGRGLDTRLEGALHLTSDDGRLAMNGAVRTAAGTYKAYRQNLAIERGVISFDGDIASPRLDILAVRPDIDARVGVVVIGPVATPRVRLFSEPDMPEMDKLTWLMMGRAPEGLGRDDTALLQRAALAALAGEKSGDDGFLQRAGIDSLSLRREEDTGAMVLGIGKQLSQRLYVGYEQAVAGSGGAWQLLYRVARRFTIRAQAGQESATLDVIRTWRWDGDAAGSNGR